MNLTMIAAISTDGFIAGQHCDMSWLSNADQLLLKQTMRDHDTILMGMKTYNAHKNKFVTKQKTRIVFTRSKVTPNDPRVRFYNGEPSDHLKELSDKGTTKALLLGGAELYNYFLKKDLVSEVMLVIEPVKLHTGTLFFTDAKVLESTYGFTLYCSQQLNAEGTIFNSYKK